MGKYRPNVAAILLDQDDNILICERKKQDGSWQFPQGGIDRGEQAVDALFREIHEEVGLSPSDYDVIEYREGYRYVFPGEKRRKKGYKGQQQTYFLCRIKKGTDSEKIKVDDREFQGFRWIKVGKFKRSWLPGFKEEVYTQVFWDFFGTELKN